MFLNVALFYQATDLISCIQKATAIADWMDVEAPVAALGTEEHFEQCAELMRRGRVYANASRKCCPGNLSPN